MMFDWMPVRVCPSCEGVGTVQAPRAGARSAEAMRALGWPDWRIACESSTLTEVCGRCHGVGQVRGQLAEKKEVGDGR
jgi:hypothetical protein